MDFIPTPQNNIAISKACKAFGDKAANAIPALRLVSQATVAADILRGRVTALSTALTQKDVETLKKVPGFNSDAFKALQKLHAEATDGLDEKDLPSIGRLAKETGHRHTADLSRPRQRFLLAHVGAMREDKTPVTEQTGINEIAAMWREARIEAGHAKRREPKPELTEATSGTSKAETGTEADAAEQFRLLALSLLNADEKRPELGILSNAGRTLVQRVMTAVADYEAEMAAESAAA